MRENKPLMFSIKIQLQKVYGNSKTHHTDPVKFFPINFTLYLLYRQQTSQHLTYLKL